MSLFLLFFFLIYGSVHFYFFCKVKVAFGFGLAPGIFLALLLALMTVAPVLVRFLEKEEMETSARMVAYGGYLWMGFLFLFFTSSLALDLYHLFIRGAGVIFSKDVSSWMMSYRSAFLLPCAWGVIASFYGFFEARSIRIERVKLTSPKFPSGRGPLTIVQISDVHLGLILSQKRLKLIIEKVNEAAPDILVSTGDLVDGQVDGLAGVAKLFQGVSAPYGKFAVTGNHELYAGLRHSVDFMREAGFRVLQGEEVIIPGLICIAGVDDPVINRFSGSSAEEEHRVAAHLPQGTFTVLLKHRPVVAAASGDRVDLQLSGHVHKGQIFPFNLVTHLFYPVHAGLNDRSRHTRLYVSRGTGTWGPPIRFLAPPEVTVFELSHGSGH
jgi:predicted MPP superfamily phosphohydrolase